MADIKKCSRCKKTFATDDMTEKCTSPTKIYFADYGNKRKYAYKKDLCAKCSEEFFDWLWENHGGKGGSDD